MSIEAERTHTSWCTASSNLRARVRVKVRTTFRVRVRFAVRFRLRVQPLEQAFDEMSSLINR